MYVKEQMGHSSIQVTVDQYGHLIPGGNKQAADRLAESVDNATLEAKSATQPQPVLEEPTEVKEQEGVIGVRAG